MKQENRVGGLQVLDGADPLPRLGRARLLNGMNQPVPEVTVLIHKITKDRHAGEYRLHIKKVLGFKH